MILIIRIIHTVDIKVVINTSHSILLDYPGYNEVTINCCSYYKSTELLRLKRNEWSYIHNGSTSHNVTEHNNTLDNCSELVMRLNISGNYTFTCSSNFLLNNSVITEHYSNNITVIVKGEIYKDIVINIKITIGPSLPIVPIILKTMDFTTTSVNISWIVTGVTYTPENYIVHYNTSLNKLSSISDIVRGTTDINEFVELRKKTYSIVLTGLYPGVKYDYYITAINTVGRVNSSYSSFCTGMLLSKYQ